MNGPRVAFLGSKQMGLRCVTAMHAVRPESVASIVTFDDSFDTRHAIAQLRAFGETHAIPVAMTRTRADVEAALRAARPDLVIVCGWYWMLGPETRRIAPRGFIGVHNSLLPKYRGAAPIVWAMLNGETEVGLSMYTLGDGMDDGDVWAQISTPVSPEDYVGDVLRRLEDQCDVMVRRSYPEVLDGTLAPRPQNHAEATFGAFRRPEDGRIRWADPASRILTQIRAQSKPYPGAFTDFAGQRLTLWQAHPFPRPYFARPGELVRGGPGEVVVVCGDNRALVIEEVQLSGGLSTRAAEVIGDARGVLGDVIER